MTEDNGWYYMRARYYDPAVGRFISEDPLRFDGGDVNLYAYTTNNPVMLIDPNGLDVTVTLYEGAAGAGHLGIGVNSDITKGFYPSISASSLLTVLSVNVPGQINTDQGVRKASITISTTPIQDRQIQAYIDDRNNNPGQYNFTARNCAQFVSDALQAGRVNNAGDMVIPKQAFNKLKGQHSVGNSIEKRRTF